MWNELGISGGTAIVILIALYLDVYKRQHLEWVFGIQHKMNVWNYILCR